MKTPAIRKLRHKLATNQPLYGLWVTLESPSISEMAAALGLTPKQHSSGGKERQLGISKRGDAYLRTVLIHGARSAIRTAKGKSDRLSQWVMALAARRHPNVVVTALANKTARIAWAMLRHGTDYQPDRG